MSVGFNHEPFAASAHLVGWIYHFSNGMTFGIMYMPLVGDSLRRSWLWAILLAVGLEILMLVTPYTTFFAICLTAIFILVTPPDAAPNFHLPVTCDCVSRILHQFFAFAFS